MLVIGIGEVVIVLIVLIGFAFAKFSLAIASTITCIVLVVCYLCASHRSQYWKRRGVPAPEPNLIFGNILQMRKGFKEYDIENAKKYGGFWGGLFFSYPELDVCDLDMLKQFLIKDFGTFQNRMLDEFFCGNQEIRKRMINVLTDQHWKDVRNTITPAFTTGRIKKMFPIMMRCVDETEQIFDNLIETSNGTFDAKKVFGNLMMDVLGQSVFGVELSTQKCQDSKFAYYSQKLLDGSLIDNSAVFLILFPNIAYLIEKTFNYQFIANECDDFFVDVLRKIIKERQKNPRKENPDFLQLLLNTVEDTEDVEKDHEIMHDAIEGGHKDVLDEMDLLAQGYVFLAAGYETTATAITFATYEMAVNPHIQQMLYEEIIRVVGSKEDLEYEDVMQMTYLEQVMNETLRLYPPAIRYDRKCGADTTVNGINIEKGTSVNVAVFAIHMDERYYPNPEKFDPMRFSASEKAKRDPLTFVPFGAGPRNCIGMRFAQIEIRATLARIVHKYRFSISDEMKDKPLELDTTMLIKPKTPILLKVEKRNI